MTTMGTPQATSPGAASQGCAPTRAALKPLASALGRTGLGAPLAPAFWQATSGAMREQIEEHGRLLLPVLGLGEKVLIEARGLRIGAQAWRQFSGEMWEFDSQPHQSWLHASLPFPVDRMHNWLIVVHCADYDRQTLERLRPPLIAGLHESLCGLDWAAVDYGGHQGGRLKRKEFLEMVGPRPWFQLEHDTRTGVFSFQAWRGGQLFESFSAVIDTDFAFAMAAVEQIPVQPHGPWQPDAVARPVPTVAALDILGDAYSNLRRLLRARHGLDIDRLGPLLMWRDRPDELFEFDESEDALAAGLAGRVAEGLGAGGAQADVALALELWLGGARRRSTTLLPVVGHVYRVDLPALQIRLPEAYEPVEKYQKHLYLAPEQIFVASERPAGQWLRARAERPRAPLP